MLSPEKVRQLREGQGLDRRALAEAAGVSTDTVRRIEGGKGPVTFNTARVVALLGLNLDLEDPRYLRATPHPLDSVIRGRRAQ